MFHSVIQILLAVVGLSNGFSFSSVPSAPSLPYYNQGYQQHQFHHQHPQFHHHQQQQQNYYQPRALNYYQPNINRPVIYPQLGMSPEYHNLVYKYITEFAGNEQPPHAKVEEFGQHGAGSSEKVEESHQTNKDKDSITSADNISVKEHFRPSDFTLLGKSPQTQLFDSMDSIKTRKMNFKENPMTNPPLGGVMSNYVLLRNRPDFQNYIPFSGTPDGQVNKRQIDKASDDEDDTVVINAETPHNLKMNEEEEEETRDQGMTEEGNGNEPAVAQSKPAAIALAGPGGVAQASPVGTALVGPGGFAVAAPSGTAVAGPAGIPPVGVDKEKFLKKKLKESLY